MLTNEIEEPSNQDTIINLTTEIRGLFLLKMATFGKQLAKDEIKLDDWTKNDLTELEECIQVGWKAKEKLKGIGFFDEDKEMLIEVETTLLNCQEKIKAEIQKRSNE